MTENQDINLGTSERVTAELLNPQIRNLPSIVQSDSVLTLEFLRKLNDIEALPDNAQNAGIKRLARNESVYMKKAMNLIRQ